MLYSRLVNQCPCTRYQYNLLGNCGSKNYILYRSFCEFQVYLIINFQKYYIYFTLIPELNFQYRSHLDNVTVIQSLLMSHTAFTGSSCPCPGASFLHLQWCLTMPPGQLTSRTLLSSHWLEWLCLVCMLYFLVFCNCNND